MRIRVSSKAGNLFMIFAADAEAAENETETHIVQLDECFPSCCVPYLCCNRYRKWLMFRYRVRCFVKHRYFERIILFLILASSFVLVSIVDYCKLKLYRPLLCPAEIKGKSVTDHQQDT